MKPSSWCVLSLAVSLSASGAHAACQTTGQSSGAYQVDHRMVSVKWRFGGSLKYEHSTVSPTGQACTASQVQRRAVIEAGNLHYLPLARRWCATLNTCQDNLNSIVSGMNELTTELLPENSIREVGPPYAPYNEPGPGFWQFRDTIYDWGRMLDNLNKIRNAALEGTGTECGSTNPSVELQELLDIRIEAGKCKAGNNNWTLPPLPSSIDTSRSNDGLLTRLPTNPPIPAITPAQVSLLHATHDAHAAVTQYRCNGGTPPPPGAVKAAHATFEASAVSENQHSVFRMPFFTDVVDPAYAPTELCQRSIAQDNRHMAWMQAVEQAKPDLAWREGLAHALEHRLTADKPTATGPQLVYRLICAGPIDFCGNASTW